MCCFHSFKGKEFCSLPWAGKSSFWCTSMWNLWLWGSVWVAVLKGSLFLMAEGLGSLVPGQL